MRKLLLMLVAAVAVVGITTPPTHAAPTPAPVAKKTVHITEDSTCYRVGPSQFTDPDCWYWDLAWQDDTDGKGIVFGAWDSAPGRCGEYNDTKAHIVRMTFRDPAGNLRLAHYDFSQNVCERQENFRIEVNQSGCSTAYLVVHPNVNNWDDPGTKTLEDTVCAFA